MEIMAMNNNKLTKDCFVPEIMHMIASTHDPINELDCRSVFATINSQLGYRGQQAKHLKDKIKESMTLAKMYGLVRKPEQSPRVKLQFEPIVPATKWLGYKTTKVRGKIVDLGRNDDYDDHDSSDDNEYMDDDESYTDNESYRRNTKQIDISSGVIARQEPKAIKRKGGLMMAVMRVLYTKFINICKLLRLI